MRYNVNAEEYIDIDVYTCVHAGEVRFLFLALIISSNPSANVNRSSFSELMVMRVKLR